jgi:hypothetical protein
MIKTLPMTVGQLRKALDGLVDDMPVTVRASDDDNDFCGGIKCTVIERAHDEDETVHFCIDAARGPPVCPTPAAWPKKK